MKIITAIRLLLTESTPWSLLLKCSITSHFGRLGGTIVAVVDAVISFIIECADTGDLKSSRITLVGVGWRSDEHRRAFFRKFAHVSYMFSLDRTIPYRWHYDKKRGRKRKMRCYRHEVNRKKVRKIGQSRKVYCPDATNSLTIKYNITIQPYYVSHGNWEGITKHLKRDLYTRKLVCRHCCSTWPAGVFINA